LAPFDGWVAFKILPVLQWRQVELCAAASILAKGAIETTMKELVSYIWGWIGYSGFCQTPEVLMALTW
jgi:hypothetical protein